MYMFPANSTPRVVPIGTLAVHSTLPPGSTKLGEQEYAVVLVVFSLTNKTGLPTADDCVFVSATVRKVLCVSALDCRSMSWQLNPFANLQVEGSVEGARI
jgi:hypothetical protein